MKTFLVLAALQRHYAIVQALALEEDEMPEVKDETAPDEEGMARYRNNTAVYLLFHIYPSCFHFLYFLCFSMEIDSFNCRPGVVKALEEFKLAVYGENYEEENDSKANGKTSEASRKRKAIAENAVKESANYNWADLADNGKVKLCFYYLICFWV